MGKYGRLVAFRSLCAGVTVMFIGASQSFAQHCSADWTPEYKCMEHCGPCPGGGNTGSGGGGVIDPTFGILTEIVRLHDHAVQMKAADTAQKNAALAAKAASDAHAIELNQQGLAAWNAGNFESAVGLFRQAHQIMPDNPVIEGNLRQASERVEGDKARTAEIHQGQDRLEAAVNHVQAVASVAGLDFDGADIGTNRMSPETGSLSADSPVTSMSNDPMVVDARFDAKTLQAVSDYRELLGIKDPEVGERMRKGLQAVANGDWPVALAWWQEALNRDPHNLAIQRSIDLAQSTLDYRARIAKLPPTPYSPALDAWSKGKRGDAMALMRKTAASSPESAEAAKPVVNQMLDFTALDEALERKLTDPIASPTAPSPDHPASLAEVKAFTEQLGKDPVLYAKVLKEEADSMEKYGMANIACGLALPAGGAKEAPETTLGFQQMDAAYKMNIIAGKAALCNCIPNETPAFASSLHGPEAAPHN